MAVETRTDVEPLVPEVVESPPGRLSWGAIFGGTFTAIGLWIFLAALGLAISLTIVDPQQGNLRGAAVFLGIWALISPIIALFLGSYVAAGSGRAVRRSTGMLYGVVVWGFVTFIGSMFFVNAASAVVGRTLSFAGNLISGAGAVAGKAAGAVAGEGASVQDAARSIGNFVGVDRSDLVNAVNQRLEQRGLPPIQPQQLQAALRDAVGQALRQGEMNQEIMLGALERNTRLDREEAQQIAQQLQQEWDQTVGQVTQRLGEVAQDARQTALAGLENAGTAFWVLFASMGLGLLASLGAGVLAAGRVERQVLPERRRVLRRPETITPTPQGA